MTQTHTFIFKLNLIGCINYNLYIIIQS